MVSPPIAAAPQNGPQLVAELRRKCGISARARRRLECLADGGTGGSKSPEEVMQELFLQPDAADQAKAEAEKATPEGDLKLQEILNHNVFVVDHSGAAALYGLPSMLNHSCAVTALKLVLVFFEKAMIFVATQDLEKGAELCHRYFDVEGSVETRRGESSKWGFSCDCCRCHFEASTLPSTPAGLAAEAALGLFEAELRYDMSGMPSSRAVGFKLSQLGVGTWQWGNKLLWGYDTKQDETLKEEGRPRVVLATKLAAYPWRLTPESMVSAVRGSLKRMGRVDIAQMHWSPRSYGFGFQEDALLDGLCKCYDLGLCRGVGLSNFGPQSLAKTDGMGVHAKPWVDPRDRMNTW
eukprot:g2620.t1